MALVLVLPHNDRWALSVVEHAWVRPNDHRKSYMVSMESKLKVFPPS